MDAFQAILQRKKTLVALKHSRITPNLYDTSLLKAKAV